MGTYSEWDEEKKLEFLVIVLKGKRPFVPPTIEVIYSMLAYKQFDMYVYYYYSMCKMCWLYDTL